MFLRRIYVENLKSIRSIQIEFERNDGMPRNWTYLLGENGVGKSTVLRAIALVMAGGDAVYELVGDPNEWIRQGQQEAKIVVDFATQQGEHRQASLTFRRGSSVVEFIGQNHQSLSPLDRAIEKSARNYFVVGYGVSRRASSDKHRRSFEASFFRSPRARAVATLFNVDASLVSLEQWAMDLDYRRGDTGLQYVRTALDQLLPEVTFGGIDKENRRLYFETTDGRLPFDALSDGYQAMASWCGDLLWQITDTFQEYNDPLKARGLLLVDEIDLHLHPVWQRSLVSFLKKTLPNVQVVVTTHSPLTVHQADEGELFVLRRPGGEGAFAERFNGAPNKMQLPQLLQSPLFGFETLDSPQVEHTRELLRKLQGIGSRKKPSAADSKRIEELRSSLGDLPSSTSVPRYLQRTNKVLKRLASEIMNDPDGANALSSVVRQANSGERDDD